MGTDRPPDESNDGKQRFWIGFDLGGTKMMSVVFDDNFVELGKSRRKTKGREGMSAGLKRINTTIRDSIEDAGIDPKQVTGLGIGCPGPLDFKKGVIREAPNLGWTMVPIRQNIEEEFGFPAAIGNDVDVGVFGEYSFGAGRGARCLVGIFPGTGVGGGCVYEGRLLRGANTTCMEIGHIPMLSDGPLDGAGNRGSLESVASRLAIAGLAAQATFRGQARTLMKGAGPDVGQIRSRSLAAAVKGGDKAVGAIIEQAAEFLGLAVVTVVHLLAPDVIVLGGGLIEAMPELILPVVEKTAKKRVLPSLRNEFKIVEAKLGDHAAVMGAAALAKQHVIGP